MVLNIKTKSITFPPIIIIIKLTYKKKKHNNKQVLLHIFSTWKNKTKSKIVIIIIKIKRPMKLSDKSKIFDQIG